MATMAEEILVSAAISLTDVLTEIGARFASEPGGCRVRFNFAGSGALAQQILAGAPADVFAAASPEEMDDLAKAGKTERESRVDFAANRLVLVAPAGRGNAKVAWSDLPKLRRVAIGNPDSVPAGRYAREVLTARGVWKPLKGKLVFAENVRQALAYVASGDADAGVVFATDARAAGARVRVMATAAPGWDHAPIVYPAAVVTQARRRRNPAAARRFVAYLRSARARAILARHGFSPVGSGGGSGPAR
ncbi:MAG TPA: molybdate ABC transporter substrate-binding protein [Armatimonadaceae bacterium]|nr:molybdate ABC transporter substrate-binding protein [Armatimonadaceae bacterium]